MRAACRRPWIGVLLTLAFLMTPTPAWAMMELDDTFSGDGSKIVRYSYQDVLTSVLVRPDGRILLTGTLLTSSGDSFLAATQLHRDGSFDRGFAVDGRLTLDPSSDLDLLMSSALDSHGRLVLIANRRDRYVAGQVQRFRIFRYNVDGTRDSSFGEGGRVISDLRPNIYLWDAAVDSKDRILIVGTSGSQLTLVRYRADGELDRGFGACGTLLTDVAGGVDSAVLALQADGKIVVVGAASGKDRNKVGLFVLRLNPNGSLDRSFGNGGRLVIWMPPSYRDVPVGVTVDGKGRIVIGGTRLGSREGESSRSLFVYRLLNDGSFDQRFGRLGRVVSNVGDEDTAMYLQVDATDRILLAGTAVPHSDHRHRGILLRYLPNGAPDNTLGQDGMLVLALGTAPLQQARSLALWRDRIIVGGSVGELEYEPSALDFAVAVYRPR